MFRPSLAPRLTRAAALTAALAAAVFAATAAPAAAEPPTGPGHATGPATVARPPDGPARPGPAGPAGPAVSRPGTVGGPAAARPARPAARPIRPAARPVVPARPPRTALVLGRAAAAGYAAAVTLHCTPPGGGHPQPVRACAALAAAGARPDRLTPAATLCTMEHAPVTAELRGWWRGHPVDWSHTYGNECELRRATGVLFGF